MKNYLLMIIAIFISTAVYPNNSEKVEVLATKITLQNKEGYFESLSGPLSLNLRDPEL